jgi:hypothetical protein
MPVLRGSSLEDAAGTLLASAQAAYSSAEQQQEGYRCTEVRLQAYVVTRMILLALIAGCEHGCNLLPWNQPERRR